ncbi:MAG: hypothetical protein IH571_01660, partial [Acholeplasmataceae bacterium]|nr:hypothetical protein [Acholeplasmataceae bacterium]
MRKYLKKALILIMLSFALIAFGIEFFDFDGSKVIAQDPYEVLHEHRFNALPTPNIPESNYITYTEFRNEIGTTSNNILSIDPQTWGKTLRIDSAEELYRFSIDVSYNMTYTTYETKLTQPAIERLLSFDYALGNDVDYSVMKSKRFNPIGYQFEIEEITYDQSFKGTFDGNGFEISNLYLSGYSQLTEKLNEGTELETTVSYIEYYSMFAYNEGTIQNLGLINPTFEFTFESETLFKASNLVGRNEDDGHVHHVYVIDTRASALIAGIRMVTSAGQAAGVMFENHGSFHDAYFVSRVVINASYGSRFSVQPVLYENHIGGDAYNLAFDDTLYQEIVTISGSSYNITTPNLLAEAMTSVALRSQNTVLGSGWYYYPAENNPTAKYPSLLGLETGLGSFEIVLSDDPTDKVIASTYFIIESAIDLIAFSKMLNYTREAGLTPYRELNYIITTSIDMSSIANNAYITPSVEFSGIFAGANNDIFIYGLDIVNGTVQDGYFSGMFGILSGQVYNLLFYDATILLDETDDYASIPTYVGLIAGQLVNGKIRNILVEIDIDLGHATLGELHVGAIVGQASGVVSSIYGEGIIQANNDHVFRTDIVINPVYQLGGLVGSSGTQQLILTDAYNQVDIHGIGTSSTSINATSSPIIHMGGVIGRVTYTVEANHVLGLLTNTAELSVNELKSDYSEVQFVGGVIGTSSGTTYTLYNATGKFMSMGTIHVLNRGTNQIVASGVLISNHSEEVEFIHLYNQSSSHLQYYTVNPGNGQVTGDFSNLSYTSLVYNIGQGVVLSQSRNNANIEIYGNYDYSGVYHSVNQAASLLRFVTNNGDITFQNQTMGSTRMFAGITLSQNVDFLNVTYDGIIRISNILMQTSGSDKELFVAGITHTLTNGKYMKNSMVHGEIKLAGITSNEVDRTQKNNIYVGGFVVYNRSGNMDPNGTLSMPKATIGIINSINSADITSTYTSSIRGIIGHANVFVGGIASFNDGDIQDSANLGDIRFENLSNVDNTNVEFSQSTSTGGAVEKYRYGVIAGGISAAVMSYRSRIYDSSNSGIVIALSRNFSRAGGILAIATFLELEVGNIQLFYTVENNNIQNSILSNCINYGNISALTISISTYTNQDSSFSLNVRYDATQPVSWYTGGWFGTTIYINTTTSTQERPGIHASSGGVIGYGLSVMRRMVNHGQVSSSDVAGGVVGATFVLTTIGVKIDTAINYGTVRAFNSETVQNFYDVDIMDYDTIRDGFYAVDDPFIFPSTRSDIRLFPENKRGFGGIFGRLQRALSQVMYGNGTNGSIFNFIVNMDPNVDLIGRLDQVYNYTSSVSFFDFTGAKYYSARKDDTTQAVFTGYTYFTRSSSVALYRITQNISIDSQKYEYSYDSQSGQWMRTTYWQPTNRIEINLRGRKFTKIGQAGATSQNNQTEIISRSAGPTFGGSGWQLVAGSQIAVGTLNEYKYIYDLPFYNQVWDI